MQPEPLLDQLVEEVQQFAQTEEFDDDVCLLAMEVDRLATPESPAR